MNENLIRVCTGIPELDQITKGGFISHKNYLITGNPGSGKTTLGIHFILAGVMNNEKTLIITFNEYEKDIKQNMQGFGFNLDKVAFLDLTPTSDIFTNFKTYDIFSPSEVERTPITEKIIETVKSIKPSRVLVDSVTQFRQLSPDEYQYRKQILAFIHFLSEEGCTVVLTSESSPKNADEDLKYICDGIIDLSRSEQNRFLELTKFRGSNFVGGFNYYKFTPEGIKIYPRIIIEKDMVTCEFTQLSSGNDEIDSLLFGGIEQGTVSIISGPSGIGKTTLGLQFVCEMAKSGEKSLFISFEESEKVITYRSTSLNLPVRDLIQNNNLTFISVNPLVQHTDEFALMLKQAVEDGHYKLLMIDSIAGYQQSLKGMEFLERLNHLCKYFKSRGIITILINETEWITGEFRATEMGISYLCDNLIFLRYFEYMGQLKKYIGVLKKRLTDYEHSMREFELTSKGIKVGQPLINLKGILHGVPEITQNPERIKKE